MVAANDVAHAAAHAEAAVAHLAQAASVVEGGPPAPAASGAAGLVGVAAGADSLAAWEAPVSLRQLAVVVRVAVIVVRRPAVRRSALRARDGFATAASTPRCS